MLREAKHLTSDAYLKRGDVLVKTSGHTAMALEDGALAEVESGVPGSSRPTGGAVNDGSDPTKNMEQKRSSG